MRKEVHGLKLKKSRLAPDECGGYSHGTISKGLTEGTAPTVAIFGNFPGYRHYLAMDVHEIRLVQSITKEARVVVESVDYSNFYLASKLPT